MSGYIAAAIIVIILVTGLMIPMGIMALVEYVIDKYQSWTAKRRNEDVE